MIYPPWEIDVTFTIMDATITDKRIERVVQQVQRTLPLEETFAALARGTTGGQ